MKTALVAGGSGLIGKFLISFLLSDNQYSKVISIGRRTLDIASSKLDQRVVDMDNLSFSNDEKIDDVYCCLGTTIKKAGSQENFRKVDFQYPLNVGQAALANGAKRFTLVSSIGANDQSSIFYSRTKGEVENVIGNLGFERVDIMRPSALVGPRQEFRLGEKIGLAALKVFGFLLVGKSRRYRAIRAEDVARAMWQLHNEIQIGVFIHESDEIKGIAK